MPGHQPITEIIETHERRKTGWEEQFYQVAAEEPNYTKYGSLKLDGVTVFARASDGDIIAEKTYTAYNLAANGSVEIQQEAMDTTLGQVLSTPLKFDIFQIATVCREILSAIDHLQQSHIVHHNIKPENVLLTCQGLVKIGDFSHASITTNENDIYTDTSSLSRICIEMLELWAHELSRMDGNPVRLRNGGYPEDVLDFVAFIQDPMRASKAMEVEEEEERERLKKETMKNMEIEADCIPYAGGDGVDLAKRCCEGLTI
ncbi:hypothetical protein DFP73DRAFT_596249 [Morchella snyderi]|nr:hypothetical protein DFP73DRAFT_596249 [Morchella snyderi]